MKKTIWIIMFTVWIISLAILIISLTDLVNDNPFNDYRFIIGIWFITLTGFMRIAYKRQKN